MKRLGKFLENPKVPFFKETHHCQHNNSKAINDINVIMLTRVGSFKKKLPKENPNVKKQLL
jgi:hypothetical protein